MDKITQKFESLRANGLDLGALREPQDLPHAQAAAQYGGTVGQYERGNIYWHPVMKTDAHEVHGGILERYLRDGGPGINPKTQNRELGFPLSDETLTADGLYPVSYFEWGAIYWKEGTGKQFGSLFQAWQAAGAEAGPLAYPVMEPSSVAGGECVFYDRGCLWKGPATNNQVLSFSLTLPPLGRPAIWNTEAALDAPLPIEIRCLSDFATLVAVRQNQPSLFLDLWRDRLFLQRVVAADSTQEEVPILCVQAPAVAEPGSENFAPMNPIVCLLPSGTKLADRALYNVVHRDPADGRSTVLAPHALYAKQSWENFGVMHATDIHTSRRLDGFRSLLQQASYPDGVALYNCFNDNFREAIRYANLLHDKGVLDLILATGDLVDYIHEEDDHPDGPGNYDFFRRLLLGLAPSSNPEILSEELRVPIFTVPGNHDYRKSPYLLDFAVHADWLVANQYDLAAVRNYPSHNLTEKEALAVQHGGRDGSRPSIVADNAAPMVAVDKENRAYFKYINDKPNYVVSLGKNRIAMLNTKYDVGVVDSEGGALVNFFGYGSADENQFVGGSPNSIGLEMDARGGVVSDPLQALRTALAQAEGTVIVGLHAPPLNISGNENPFYFRETAHRSADPQEILSFLLRRGDPYSFQTAQKTFDVESGLHKYPGWMTNGHAPGDHFKSGHLDELLEYSVSAKQVEPFLELCLGTNALRPADLVLCGHLHSNIEFRLARDTRGGFRFYTDFYTENPSVYYHTAVRGLEDIPARNSRDGWSYVNLLKTKMRKSSVEVRETVDPQLALPKLEKWESAYEPYWRAQVPAYSNPLNSSGDSRAWWNQHRPIIVQTAGLGPLENNQRPRYEENAALPSKPDVTFQGFRVIAIQDNVINRVHYVRLAELRESNFHMPWEPFARESVLHRPSRSGSEFRFAANP